MTMMLAENNRPHIGDYWLSATEVADILWLVALMAPPPAAVPEPETAPDEPLPASPSPVLPAAEATTEAERDREPTTVPSSPSGTTGVAATYHAPDPVAAVYSPDAATETDSPDAWGGVGFKAPRAPAILEKAAMMRALRPLQRHIPSTRHFVLHEAETAERIAAALLGHGSWRPARYPAPERWLDLVVLVDDAPSMALWQQTVAEFIALLGNTGIFRNVQRWTLALVEAAGAVNDEQQSELHLYPAPATADSAYRRRAVTELLDQQRRRLFLVVTDCSSVVWDSGVAQRLLQPLAAHNLVSLVQVLPEEMWPTTALGLAEETRLTTSWALAANAELLAGQRRPDGAYPIPVVSLEPESLRRWSSFLVGRERRSVVGYYLPAETDATIDVDQALLALGITPQPAAEEPALALTELYDRFRERTPQQARPLAAYFAAAPLTLPVMRLVQAALLPHTTHADFVRVFYSGLLQRVTVQTAGRLDSDIVYDFVGGDEMRQFLLTRLPRYSAEQVVELVIAELSRYIQEHLDQLASFDAIIAVPGALGALHVDATAQHFAEVTAKVLRYLGGVYATMADRLEHVVLSVIIYSPQLSLSKSTPPLQQDQGAGDEQLLLPEWLEASKDVDADMVEEHDAPVTEVIRMIIEHNQQRGRLRWYLDQGPAHTEQSYRALVAQEYEAQHRFIEALQVRKEPAEWQKLHERLHVMAQRLFGRWGFSTGLSQQMAVDAAQDVCLGVLHAHYPYDCNFEAWTAALLRRTCLKYARSARPDEKVQIQQDQGAEDEILLLSKWLEASKDVDADIDGEHDAPVTEVVRMIIEHNRQTGRLRWYLDQDPAHTEQSYRALVAQEYEAKHRFIEALQVRKEPAEWQKLYERLQVMAQRLFGRWGFSSGLRRQMADDVAQDACLGVLHAHYPYDCDFEAWTATLLRRTCLKYAKSARADQKAQTDLEQAEFNWHATADQDIELALGASTERALAAVAQLSSIQQEVIIAHYMQGQSLSEIAAATGVLVNTIYKRHSDALVKLRRILGT